MDSKTYWQEREKEQLKHNITDEKEYEKELKKIYQRMLDNCQKEIDSFYGKYADKEGITLAEAKKRVASHDVQAFERKAAQYVKNKDFSAQANEELRLYNATMKINRLEMLKANIGLELISGHDELQKFMGGILKGRTEEELKRQAGILGKTVKNNAQTANAIVNGSFHSGTFSDRIWQYQDLMREELGRLLQTGLIQGKNPRAIAKDLKRYWYGNDPKTGGGALYCMERLMRTELARVQTEAQKQAFERNGFSMYTFHVNGGCCDICKALDGKHFKVAKMMPGTNAPPMHPHCRCSTSAYEDSKEYEAWLEHLANGGTTAEWNATKKKSEKVLTVQDINEASSAMLGNAYEYHRIKNNMTSVPFDELDKELKIVNANYGKMGVDSAKAFNDTLENLIAEYDTPLQKIRTMTKEEFTWNSSAFAYVSHNYTVDSAEFVINPGKCKELDKLTERINELSESGYCVKIPERNAGKYVATHEFAHTLLNLEQPLKNKTNWLNADYNKIKKARKEIKTVYDEYLKEVQKLTEKRDSFNAVLFDFNSTVEQMEEAGKKWTEYDNELNKVKLSDYSLQDADEFMAESFANEKIGVSSKKHSKLVIDILDKHFKR